MGDSSAYACHDLRMARSVPRTPPWRLLSTARRLNRAAASSLLVPTSWDVMLLFPFVYSTHSVMHSWPCKPGHARLALLALGNYQRNGDAVPLAHFNQPPDVGVHDADLHI